MTDTDQINNDIIIVEDDVIIEEEDDDIIIVEEDDDVIIVEEEEEEDVIIVEEDIMVEDGWDSDSTVSVNFNMDRFNFNMDRFVEQLDRFGSDSRLSLSISEFFDGDGRTPSRGSSIMSDDTIILSESSDYFSDYNYNIYGVVRDM